MAFVDVVFSDYAPDRGGSPWFDDPGYLVDAVGVRRAREGWRVAPDATLVAGGGTLASTGNIVSGFHTISDNTQNIFAASGTEIFQTEDKGTTWNDVTSSTAPSSSNAWDWERFNEYVFATSSNTDFVQYKDTTATVAALFSELAVAADTVGRVRDHLVIGNLGASESSQLSVRWSSIGDPLDYPTPGSASALAAQSGTQIMPSTGGVVKKVVGQEKSGIVFQERAISRMTYVGGNVVYSFDNFERQVGLGDSRVNSVAEGADEIYYWLNRTGFYATDGYKVKKLAGGKIHEALMSDNLNHPDALSSDIGVHGVHDIEHNQVMIVTDFAKLLAYNYETGSFSFPDISSGFATGLFDGVVSAADFTPQIYGIKSDELMYQITAAPSDINIQTAFIELVPGQRFQFKGVYLQGAQTTTPTIAFKIVDDPNNIDLLQTGFTTCTAAARDIKQTGRGTGRFIAFRITGAQGLAAVLTGLRIYFEPVSEE